MYSWLAAAPDGTLFAAGHQFPKEMVCSSSEDNWGKGQGAAIAIVLVPQLDGLTWACLVQLSRIESQHDVGVIQLGQQAHLGVEALAHGRVAVLIDRQDLDGGSAVEM